MMETNNLQEKLNMKNFFVNSNPWFILSVIITIFLLVILTWNVINSYRMIKNIEEQELALEKSAGQLLFHSKSLEMSIFMAASTGDLRWKDNYEKHKPQLNEVINKINQLAEVKEATRETSKIKKKLKTISRIEDKAFKLISRGNKGEAKTLLKGWTYTKNQLDIEGATKNLRDVLDRQVSEAIARERRNIFLLSIFVVISLIILIIAWYIFINQWRSNRKARREKEEKIMFLSYHDHLTELYNRRYFMKNGQNELREVKKKDEELAIIMIDLDNFKEVNDNFGHDIGDLVLQKTASRLEDIFGDNDIVARLGGDEFTIVLTDINFKEDIKQVVNRLINYFNQPLIINQSKLFISISVGVSIYPNDGENLEELIKNADNAMYRAKKQEENGLFYSS
ncbi:MAG: diguanylate cyclase domain-containing protein [Bacillota bacterium]